MKNTFAIITGFIVFLILFNSTYAQKNLALVNTTSHKNYRIEKQKKIRWGIAGYEKEIRATLINVTDTGILLKGKFPIEGKMQNVIKFVSLNDVIYIRKLSAAHKTFRVLSGIAIVSTAAIFTSLASDYSSDTGSNGAFLIPLGLLEISLEAILFYKKPHKFMLGDVWKLVIQ